MKKLLVAILSVILCISLSSCEKKEEIKTEVSYTVYDIDGCDKISIYMSSNTKEYGVWQYDISALSCFSVYNESDTNYGGENTSRITLILQPEKVGSDTVTFRTEQGRMEVKYVLTVEKDSEGIFRITVA